MVQHTDRTDFHRLFQPQSIAHVGASNRPAAGRFNFTKYLINMGFPGKVFPVNPNYEEVCDLACYPSLSAIPEPDVTGPLDKRPVGGLGIHFIRKMTDEVRYMREGGCNVLSIFVKREGTVTGAP